MEDFNLVRGFEARSPIWTIAYKAVVYAIVFYLVLRCGRNRRRPAARRYVAGKHPSIAGGTPQGMLGAEVITSLALVPYFAFKEVGKAFGERQLHEHCLRAIACARERSGRMSAIQKPGDRSIAQSQDFARPLLLTANPSSS
jgi:hypothetical protein